MILNWLKTLIFTSAQSFFLSFNVHAGFVELPDGKVLSGSEWGNMLLWDGGLIKVEICRKGNKLCHNGMIEQFFMDEGELMTIGADGWIYVRNTPDCFVSC